MKQRLRLLELMDEAKDKDKWAFVITIQGTLRKADVVAKIDMRHAHGILDRFLKSDACMGLVQEGDKEWPQKKIGATFGGCVISEIEGK